MDTKWFVFYGIAIVAFAFGAEAYGDYTKSECAKAYATSTHTADDIAKICKVK